jgi:hypothetical protein
VICAAAGGRRPIHEQYKSSVGCLYPGQHVATYVVLGALLEVVKILSSRRESNPGRLVRNQLEFQLSYSVQRCKDRHDDDDYDYDDV